MCVKYLVIFFTCIIFQISGQWPSSITLGKGVTIDKPIYLNGNYIPAAMHVMFYLSDQMKYDIKPAGTPSPVGTGTSTTTLRPTPPHKPGYYAPEKPAGPIATVYAINSGGGWGFSYGVNTENQQIGLKNVPQILPEDIDLLGAGPSELLRQINTLEDVDSVGDDDDDVQQLSKFSVNYEDVVDLDFLRQKRVPPTRAFVTLLSLYDLLNKEAKDLGLNKFNGYGDSILQELIQTSSDSSSDQLKFVLSKIIEKKNTRKDNVLKKIKAMLSDLEKVDSYINNAIKYIPALQFSLAKCA